VTLLCGSRSLPWATLQSTAEAISLQPVILSALDGQRVPSPQGKRIDGYYRTLAIRDLRTSKPWDMAMEHAHQDPTRRFLSESLAMLQKFRCSQSTDPRDSVFSLIGVMPRSFQAIIRAPDYSISARSMYMDIATLLINHHQSFDILFSAGMLNQAVVLPSWCPDWSTLPPQTSIGCLMKEGISLQKTQKSTKYGTRSALIIGKENPGSATRHGFYQAGGRLNPKVGWGNKGNILISSGKVMGIISEIQDGLQPDITPNMDIGEFQYQKVSTRLFSLRACMTMASTCAPYPSGHDHISVCGQTLMAGLTRDLKRVPADEARSAMASCLIVTEVFKDRWLEFNKTKDYSILKPAASEHEEGSLVFAGQYEAFTRGRVFFTTTNNYMGLAPVGSMPGDAICVVQGCSIPLVMRPKGDHWILIGESYVHGIMDGEAMDMNYIESRNIAIE